ncbi:MAG: hypothetical protein EPO60_02420 [Rugosibacter sp.]|nr:MAG: hypothetical protein EPO60_02420 [Rugosibacter sp.]
MNVKDALHELPIARNTKKLLPLWPDIEAKLAAGVSQVEIVALLNGNGFDMTLATFKTYLHRQRKRNQRVSHGQHAKPVLSAPRGTETVGVVAPATSPPITAVKVGATRPPTFDYDPRGIPDLLK